MSDRVSQGLPRWTKNRAAQGIAGALAAFLAASGLQAAPLYWDTATTAGIQTANGTWDFNTTALWSSSTAGSNPLLRWTSNSDTASFTVGLGGNTVTVSSANGQVGAAGVNFTGTGGGNTFTVSGASIQLGTGGINSTMGNQVVNVSAPLVLGGSQTWSSTSLRTNSNGAAVRATGAVSSLAGTTNLAFDGLGVSNPTTTGNTGTRTSMLLGSANTFSGTTTVTGGAALWLDYVTNTGSRLDDSSALILNNGSIVMNGGSSILEVVASTTVGAGASTIYAGANGGGGTANKIQLGDITHQTGGTLDVTIAVSGIASTTTLNTNGILGGWATIGTNSWATGATVAATNTNIAGNAGTDRNASSLWLTTDNVSSTTSESSIGSKTVNTLRLKNASVALGFAPGAVLTMTAGGILSANTGQSLSGGSIQPGTASGELFVHTPNAFSISSAIIDNGSIATVLVKAGANTLTLSGTTNYTGGTYINAGTLQVTGTSSISGNVTQQGATTLDVRSGGTIAPGTPAATGTMSLGGNLTLADGSVMNLRLGTLSDLISLTNPFETLTGSASSSGITLNLSDAGGLTTQTYTLMQWQAGTTLSSFDLSDFAVTAPAGATGTLQFGTNSLEYVVTSVAAIPEPASLGLLALGALGLLMRSRRP